MCCILKRKLHKLARPLCTAMLVLSLCFAAWCAPIGVHAAELAPPVPPPPIAPALPSVAPPVDPNAVPLAPTVPAAPVPPAWVESEQGNLTVAPMAPDTLGQETVDELYGEERYATYRYVVNVEFGSMSFYYDWGRWNVDEIAYVADDTSLSPAASTDDGAPGWYGFDGVSNRIGINYRRIGSEAGTEYLRVALKFDFARDESTDAPLYASDHMTLTLYDTADFSGPTVDMNAQNAYAAELIIAPAVDDVTTSDTDESALMQDYYLSIGGAPYHADATRYESASPAALGILTVSIDFAATRS